MDSGSFKHYLLGITHIDDEHKKVFDLIDQIKGFCTSGEKEKALEVLGVLCETLPVHLKKEEEFMEAVSYPYTKHHIGNHRALGEDLEKLKDSFCDHLSNHVMRALSEAVLNHIDRYDMQFSDYYRDWLRVNNVSRVASPAHN